MRLTKGNLVKKSLVAVMAGIMTFSVFPLNVIASEEIVTLITFVKYKFLDGHKNIFKRHTTLYFKRYCMLLNSNYLILVLFNFF